ncbi:MAG: hypothetical protein GWN86_05225, partial [Desulfobacterales bacterium]|nr:hypothetical protein [Desulfobacterales bacterium]
DAKPHHFINFDTGKPYTYVQNKEMGEFWSQLFEATDSSPEELLWNINEYIRQNCSGAIDKEYMSAEVPWNIVCGLSQPAPTPQPA